MCHCDLSMYQSCQNSWNPFCPISSTLYSVVTSSVPTIYLECPTKRSLLFSSNWLPMSLTLATKDETYLWNVSCKGWVCSWRCVLSHAWSSFKLSSKSSTIHAPVLEHDLAPSERRSVFGQTNDSSSVIQKSNNLFLPLIYGSSWLYTFPFTNKRFAVWNFTARLW